MISRAVLSRANAAAARRAAAHTRGNGGGWRRYQSTSTGSGSGTAASHVVAGVAGGGVVILAGYGYYHTSGLKKAVQTSKEVQEYLRSTKDAVVQKARESAKNPSAALEHLKSITRSYVAFIPGASGYVDTTFDQIEELRQTHGDEVDKVVKEVTNDISRIASEGSADFATASQVYDTLRKGVAKLQELSGKIGGDLLEKNPQLKEKLGGGFEQLKSLAEKGGPQAKKVYDDVKSQLAELVKNGSLNEETIEKSKNMLKEKTMQLQELAQSSGAGDGLKAAIKSLPMGSDILDKAPHLQDILDIAKKEGKEAKELIDETYRDLVTMLEEKGKKAKELAEKTKDKAEKKGN